MRFITHLPKNGDKAAKYGAAIGGLRRRTFSGSADLPGQRGTAYSPYERPGGRLPARVCVRSGEALPVFFMHRPVAVWACPAVCRAFFHT